MQALQQSVSTLKVGSQSWSQEYSGLARVIRRSSGNRGYRERDAQKGVQDCSSLQRGRCNTSRTIGDY